MKPNTPLATVLLTAVACSGASAAWFDDLAGINLGGGPNIPVLPIATRYSGQETHVYLMDLQGAIDDAQPGDRIEVGPGTWNGGLMISNKNNIEIVGISGPAQTIVDGGDASRGLLIDECSHITIQGLGFEHCIHDAEQHHQRSGAVRCENSDHVTFNECWFRYNHSPSRGGGIDARNCDWFTLSYCFFANNVADVHGGAAGGSGGGAYIEHSFNASVLDCVFLDNYARWGGGLNVTGRRGGEVTIAWSYFMSNEGDGGSALWTANPPGHDSAVTVSQCVLADNFSTGRLVSGAVWVGEGVSLQSLTTMYWKNRGVFAASLAVADGGDLQMGGCLHAGNRALEGENMMIVRDGGQATVQNSRIDCGRSFAAEIAGNYSTHGSNEEIDHCVYTVDMNFDATVDIVDLLTLLEHWGNTNMEIADIVRGNPDQEPTLDADDLILMLETWGQWAENPLM